MFKWHNSSTLKYLRLYSIKGHKAGQKTERTAGMRFQKLHASDGWIAW